MAGIHARDTIPERAVRRYLHARGLRFRLCVGELPGRPDLVLPKYNAVIFVNGCFWHQHPRCSNAKIPASNANFWRAKFDANVDRDSKALLALGLDSWRVAIFWECAVRRSSIEAASLAKLERWLRSGRRFLEIP